MKLFGIILASLFVFINSYALELRDIVVGEDYSELPVFRSFPCSIYIDVIFCGNSLVLEKGCAKTLKISDKTLSCTSLQGDQVEFGQIDEASYIEDSTMGGTGGYHVKYSSRVQLKELKTPNGNTEYQLIVK
ncbi:MAG: hypothetical protein ACXVB1_07840 [Pseudobdellovibrionaceae bacterium]